MKKSDLRRIIKEEVINVIRKQNINEAFGDPLAAKLSKLGGMKSSRWQNFWRSSAKTYDIAWDKLPKGSIRKVQPSDKAAKTGMAFYVINSDKPNPFASSKGWAYDTNLRGPAVLAVTVDNKIQYYGADRSGGRGQGGIGAKQAGSYSRSASSPVGAGSYGTLMVKKLKQLADDVYVFDLESYRGGTTALKGKRAELKLGKDTFKDAKSWKQANLRRYQDIISARVGTRDQVDAMVAKIVKMSNEAVEKAMALPKMGRYNNILATVNNNEIDLENVTKAMSKSLYYYGEYIQLQNDTEKEKAAGGDDYGGRRYEYNDDRMKSKAGDIKKILNKFKSGKLDGWY
tara:strand:- start:82 stop:1110 length:1029 start_codon:yes stop_codon:yes gene_type:complete